MEPDRETTDGRTEAEAGAGSPVVRTRTRVRQMDHTADVGVEVEAPDLDQLLAGAVDGMMELILGGDRPGEDEARTVRVQASEPALLLRNLLREVLFLHEAEGFAVARAAVAVERGPEPASPGAEVTGTSGVSGAPGDDQEAEWAATAELHGGPDPGPPIRELKGVTLHGLEAREKDSGEWFARVIFDV